MTGKFDGGLPLRPTAGPEDRGGLGDNEPGDAALRKSRTCTGPSVRRRPRARWAVRSSTTTGPSCIGSPTTPVRAPCHGARPHTRENDDWPASQTLKTTEDLSRAGEGRQRRRARPPHNSAFLFFSRSICAAPGSMISPSSCSQLLEAAAELLGEMLVGPGPRCAVSVPLRIEAGSRHPGERRRGLQIGLGTGREIAPQDLLHGRDRPEAGTSTSIGGTGFRFRSPQRNQPKLDRRAETWAAAPSIRASAMVSTLRARHGWRSVSATTWLKAPIAGPQCTR